MEKHKKKRVRDCSLAIASIADALDVVVSQDEIDEELVIGLMCGVRELSYRCYDQVDE